MQYLEGMGLLHHKQYGFCKNMSTELAVMGVLKQKEYPSTIYGVLLDYFQNWKSSYTDGTNKGMFTRICPGTLMWNVLLYRLWKLQLLRDCELFEYADDGLMLIPAFSMRGHEEKA
ncbi:hypothetical protein PR048_001866 [Dryococelus australis]|uniref:Reverse transcriptase domain-containing protein n=1 Tax=Dryococelus australis TaxID=614101 RepID=A0ABQ9III9_9NEOP|nr:hypothetical protein PR048_001866 [Dryococelus australis]